MQRLAANSQLSVDGFLKAVVASQLGWKEGLGLLATGNRNSAHTQLAASRPKRALPDESVRASGIVAAEVGLTRLLSSLVNGL